MNTLLTIATIWSILGVIYTGIVLRYTQDLLDWELANPLKSIFISGPLIWILFVFCMTLVMFVSVFGGVMEDE